MGIVERWKELPELPPDIRSRLERLIPLFEREGVVLAYLFGSLAERENAGDVDLALLRQSDSVFALWAAIVDRLGTERLDLVDLATASPVLRFEILRNAKLLYAADEEVLERFTMETLHLYRDTAPLRARQREYLKESFARWS
jgi:predicted nucleotidyltransferase